MPKLTLVLDRKPVQVYDLDQPVIRIGRSEGMDILIDNVSVSRRQAELRREQAGWIVRDLGSANGTFVNGERLGADRTLQPGDEISFGKFSLFFDRVLTEPVPAAAPQAREASAVRRPAPMPTEGTLHLDAAEVERLQRAAAQKRQAQLQWEAGGERGTHFIEGGGVVVGRSALCDVQVPAGPRQHLVILRRPQGFEVRDVAWWSRMRVNGRPTARAVLKSGDTIEVGKLRLTFMDEVR
jgi:predicted component of type VI protein secretion system